jgi:hypothetical protein
VPEFSPELVVSVWYMPHYVPLAVQVTTEANLALHDSYFLVDFLPRNCLLKSPIDGISIHQLFIFYCIFFHISSRVAAAVEEGSPLYPPANISSCM